VTVGLALASGLLLFACAAGIGQELVDQRESFTRESRDDCRWYVPEFWRASLQLTPPDYDE